MQRMPPEAPVGTEPLGQSELAMIAPEATPETGRRSAPSSDRRRFAVAFSFPGEFRDYVERVAQALLIRLGGEQAKSRIFYDDWHLEKVIGYASNRKLQNVYANDSDLIVPFYCNAYADKAWCGVELRAIESILHDQEFDRVLPFRFDVVEIPGSFKTDIFPVVMNWAPEKVADLIVARYNRLAAAAEIPREAAGQTIKTARHETPHGSQSNTSEALPATARAAEKASQAPAPTTDEEIAAIKRRMAGALKKSAAATDELRKVLGLQAQDETTRLDARGREAVETLVNRPHRDGTLALVQLHEALDDDARRVIGELAEDYACLLVDAEDLTSFRQDQTVADIGLFVSLPTKNETLIEIIMARSVGKRPGFAAGGTWPRGLIAIPGPPIRNDPYADEEILKAFQRFMEDQYLSMGEKRELKKDQEQKRLRCNDRHKFEIDANKRQRYFVLNDLDDYQRVLDALRRDWPSVAFVEMGPDAGKDRTNLLFLLKDLFTRKASGQG